MILKAKPLSLEVGGKAVVILNKQDADFLGLHALDRVRVKYKEKELVAIADITKKIASPGEVVTNDQVTACLNLKQGHQIEIKHENYPESVNYIKEKISGGRLERQKIKSIIEDIVQKKLSDLELAAFVTALHIHGTSMDEIESLSRAMIETGKTLKIPGKTIVEKHSITADTTVLIRINKKIKLVKIGNFVNKIIEDSGKKEEYEDNAETVEIKSGYDVLTFDDDFRISFKPLTGVFRHPAPKKLYRIKLKGNREVITTECHSIFVLKDGKIVSIPTKDLNVNDFVVVPRKPIEMNSEIKEIDFTEELLKLPESETEDAFIKGIANHFKGKIPNWLIYQDRVPFNIWRKNKVKLSNNAKLKQRYGNAFPAKIKITKDLIKILGYYVAEGFRINNGIHISPGAHEKKFIQKIRNSIKKVFGLNATITHPHETAVHINIYNKLLAKAFKIFDCGDDALTKKVPELIFNVSRKLQLEFLRAYAKGDGYTRRNYEMILGTSSKELRIGLEYLLGLNGMGYSISISKPYVRKFPNGYYSKINESYYIYTQANQIFGRNSSTAAFINFVPLEESKFGAFLEKNRNKIKDYELRRKARRQDFVTFDTAERLITMLTDGGQFTEDVIKFVRSDLGVLPVKSVEEIENETEKYVYDLCVEGYEKFIGGFGPIFLHNSIGGIPGDKTSLLAVPIIAAAGLIIPKTSSRAITSPSGTADRMEVLAPVSLTAEEIIRVVKKTNGCLVWGGAIDLAPADDAFVQIEYPLGIDPLLLPSIMSKKKAVNAKYVVIDIPTGRGAKIKTIGEARGLSEDFIELGKRLGMNISTAITFGEQPLGYAIGPALEAREALLALQGKGPKDLIDKVVSVTGILFDMVGKDKCGRDTAEKILTSGKAEKKFREIIAEQGGDPKVKPSDIPLGEEVKIKSDREGKVLWIKNAEIATIAKAAGAPKDKVAGVLLSVKIDSKVKKGDVLYSVFSSNKIHLENALKLAEELQPIIVGKSLEEKMLLDKVPSKIPHRRLFMLER